MDQDVVDLGLPIEEAEMRVQLMKVELESETIPTRSPTQLGLGLGSIFGLIALKNGSAVTNLHLVDTTIGPV